MKLLELLESVSPKAKVLDYGCFGWKLTDMTKRKDIIHHGADIMLPDGKPENASFHPVNPETQAIDVPDDYFDLIVASHVIEHVNNPIEFFSELVRVCKPEGVIYIEAPSERSLSIRSDVDADSHAFLSFWDDPTHLRPWTPAALYRLAICHGCIPIEARHLTSWKAKIFYPLKWLYIRTINNGHKLTEVLWEARGWACYCIVRKPLEIKGKPKFKYLSLRGVPQGYEAALKR